MTDRPTDHHQEPANQRVRRHPFRQTDGLSPAALNGLTPPGLDPDQTIQTESNSTPGTMRAETGRFRIQAGHEQSSELGAARPISPVPSLTPPTSSAPRQALGTLRSFAGQPPVDVLGQVENPVVIPRREARLLAPPPLASDVERLGWSPPPPDRGPKRRQSSGFARLVRLLFILSILSTTAFAVGNQELVRTLSNTPQWQVVEQHSRTAVHAVVSVVAEEPSFAPAPELAGYPICPGVAQDDEKDLESAMNLMRGTAEGERLFDQLVREDICVEVEDIRYNSGYAYGRQSPLDGTWSDSYIAVAADLLHSGETDVVASLLVHEATHIDRYVNGLACNYSDTCTSLPNGVDLDEEIAAHGAEVQWWVAAYGSDGKRFATGYDYGLNRLARAYGEGPSVFDAYVRSIRSDSREGDSIAP